VENLDDDNDDVDTIGLWKLLDGTWKFQPQRV